MMYVTIDDFRQAFVVAKNEMKKFVRGKKFTMYIALITIVFLMITVLPYVVGDGLGDTPGDVVSSYMMFVSLLVILAATLFASVTVVSEFEERTALILFTRPIKKTSIFLGKVIGCILLELTMIVAFYAAIAVVCLVVGGGVPFALLTSLGLAALFVFATSSIAIFISSVMKKGSTCAILTFVFLLLILPILSGVISSAIDPPWFMLDNASDAIANCVPEYLDMMNGMIERIEENLGIDLGLTIPAPDMLKTVVTMLGWGIVSIIMAWVAFIKREF